LNRPNIDKSEILNGDIFISFPELILNNLSWTISHQFMRYFEYKKVVNALTGLEQRLGCNLILNEKSPDEFILKGVCRGGRFDDILRGMLLYPKVDKNTL
jgi:hypothetical protein